MTSATSTILYHPRRAATDWITVDDPVMGGRSTSNAREVESEDGEPALRFAGEVSLENNGGFCSTRTEGQSWKAPGAHGFTVDVLGDGHAFKLTVRTSGHTRGSYRVTFEPGAGEREQHTFLLDDFELWDRGTRLPNAAPLDPSDVQSIGFLISDGQAGAFQLDIFSIAAT
jgi:hypothetical protein